MTRITIPEVPEAAVADLGERWPKLSAGDRAVVTTAPQWWIGFLPLDAATMRDTRAIFDRYALPHELATRWAAGYEPPQPPQPPQPEPTPTPSPAPRQQIAQPRQPPRQTARPRYSGTPSPYSGVVIPQSYAPGMPNFNGGWAPPNAPFSPFGR